MYMLPGASMSQWYTVLHVCDLYLVESNVCGCCVLMHLTSTTTSTAALAYLPLSILQSHACPARHTSDATCSW